MPNQKLVLEATDRCRAAAKLRRKCQKPDHFDLWDRIGFLAFKRG